MKKFKIKTAIIGLSLALSIALGVTTTGWATKTNKFAGSANKSTLKSHDFIKSNAAVQRGWKIFSWKIWNAAAPVLAIAAATAVAAAGEHLVSNPTNIGAEAQENALLEELN